MKRTIYHRYLILSALVLLLVQNVHVYSQEAATLYWMQGIPQSTFMNPAIQPLPDVFVGLPALSSVYLGFANSGFAVYDVLKKDYNTRLYIDETGLLEKLKDNNRLMVDFSTGLFSFGFRTKRNSYYTFSINERFESRIGYPRDLIQMIIEGNDPQSGNSHMRFDGLGTDATHFREYGISYSRMISEKLTIGLRPKLLQGLSNINFSKTHLDLYTHPGNYNLTLAADMLINTSLPFQLIPLESFEDFDFNIEEYGVARYLTNFSNIGFAADAGLLFNATDWLSMALSVRDLGYIRWKSGVENFAVTGEATFKGFRYGDLNPDDEDNSQNHLVTRMVDSIIDLFDTRETTQTFTTLMTPKIYASAAFRISPVHSIAFTGRGDFYNSTLSPSFTASYNVQPVRRFGFSLSWSSIHGNYKNFGFGFHTNLFPLQFYLVSDNVFAAMQPHTLQNINILAGMNIVVFSKKRKNQAEPSLRW
jgi:hypothetical protein